MDKGESAKTADRPDLQAMLQFVRELGSISYVIVHKVDRLARSREDDVAINLAIRHAGAQLVSATENIDETPSGKLLHGIMATIAEFYSSNLALEAKKGMRQKAKLGGTPGLAPLGYLNVRQRIEGREIRTVAIDPERAPLIQWMFEAYASGAWTMSQIQEELDGRGLRIPATAKRPARPVSIQHIDKMLVNRYYLGYVKFEGVWYEGRHPALLDQATFDRVQAVRIARALAREKTQKHPHYLKGSVFCGRCGFRARHHQRHQPLGYDVPVLLLPRPRQAEELPTASRPDRRCRSVSRRLVDAHPADRNTDRRDPRACHAQPGRPASP